MTIEENDNPGGTFQFKDDTAISIHVSFTIMLKNMVV